MPMLAFLDTCSALWLCGHNHHVWFETEFESIPVLCCKSSQQCFHNMKLKGCKNVLAGKSLLGQYIRSTHMGNIPWYVIPSPGTVWKDKMVPGTTLIRSSSVQAHRKLFYLALWTLLSSPCAPWSQFSLIHSTFSDFYSLSF